MSQTEHSQVENHELEIFNLINTMTKNKERSENSTGQTTEQNKDVRSPPGFNKRYQVSKTLAQAARASRYVNTMVNPSEGQHKNASGYWAIALGIKRKQNLTRTLWDLWRNNIASRLQLYAKQICDLAEVNYEDDLNPESVRKIEKTMDVRIIIIDVLKFGYNEIVRDEDEKSKIYLLKENQRYYLCTKIHEFPWLLRRIRKMAQIRSLMETFLD